MRETRYEFTSEQVMLAWVQSEATVGKKLVLIHIRTSDVSVGKIRSHCWQETRINPYPANVDNMASS